MGRLENVLKCKSLGALVLRRNGSSIDIVLGSVAFRRTKGFPFAERKATLARSARVEIVEDLTRSRRQPGRSGSAVLDEEHRQRAGAVGSDHEALFNVRGLARAGQKHAVTGPGEKIGVR